MTDHIIAVDLGGTRIRAALLDESLNIIDRKESLTHAHEGKDSTVQRIIGQVQEVLPEDKSAISGIGVSAPGPLNPTTGVIVRPPNLPGWEDVPLGDILRNAFNLPVYVGNDANVAILAEAARGAARGYRYAIYLTVSTGIGSGILVDGQLLLGTRGLAAEVGHMVMIVENGASTLEDEASGPDMARQAREQIQAGARSAIFDMVKGDLGRIDGAIVGRAATTGDPLALEIVSRSGKLIGMGVANLLHLFNPEIIVIGGGVAQLGDLLFNPMRKAVKQHSIDDDYWKDLIITTPDLGEDVSIIGAGTLVTTRGGTIRLNDVMD